VQRNCLERRCVLMYISNGASESVPITYADTVGNTGGADHTVGVQPATGGLVDKGAMARPLISSQLPSFHPGLPGRPFRPGLPGRSTQPVHVLQRRSWRGRRSG